MTRPNKVKRARKHNFRRLLVAPTDKPADPDEESEKAKAVEEQKKKKEEEAKKKAEEERLQKLEAEEVEKKAKELADKVKNEKKPGKTKSGKLKGCKTDGDGKSWKRGRLMVVPKRREKQCLTIEFTE